MTVLESTKLKDSAKVLAKVLHELAPSRSEEDWEKHVVATAHDPAKFFGENGQGLAEYNAFCRTYDRDTYNKVRKIKERRR